MANGESFEGKDGTYAGEESGRGRRFGANVTSFRRESMWAEPVVSSSLGMTMKERGLFGGSKVSSSISSTRSRFPDLRKAPELRLLRGNVSAAVSAFERTGLMAERVGSLSAEACGEDLAMLASLRAAVSSKTGSSLALSSRRGRSVERKVGEPEGLIGLVTTPVNGGWVQENYGNAGTEDVMVATGGQGPTMADVPCDLNGLTVIGEDGKVRSLDGVEKPQVGLAGADFPVDIEAIKM